MNNEKTLLRLEISSPGGIEKIYMITILNDRSYDVVFGKRKLPKGRVEFSKVFAKKNSKISQDDWVTLLKHIAVVEEVGGSKSNVVVKDAWRLTLKLNSGEYEVFYGYPEHMKTKVYELILEIIKLSPMKIDLHGWA